MTSGKGSPAGRRRQFGGGEKSGLESKRRDAHGEGVRRESEGLERGIEVSSIREGAWPVIALCVREGAWPVIAFITPNPSAPACNCLHHY